MAELAMRADLPVKAPAVTLQSADDVSYLHECKVRDRCDDLFERLPSCEARAGYFDIEKAATPVAVPAR